MTSKKKKKKKTTNKTDHSMTGKPVLTREEYNLQSSL